MDLTDIISISGKSGLHTIVGQSKNNVIVESLIDGKRFPTFSSNRISALKDISIYTTEGELLLSDVYRKIHDKEKAGKCILHTEDSSKLRSYLEEIVPDFDKEQVYNSDIKKLFQWYNILHDAKKLKLKKSDKKELKTEENEDNIKDEANQE
ncbi:MAG: DUF5606 domain-containing protein [Flavobacteriales bacterium]|jgi:hypothetical protein|nr:DUF5606 domain-containing protein [Flavobacteriales bacterium]